MARYVREALDSLLSQTYTNFELIISDNASTDNTQKICEEYAKGDKRIKYIRQKKNIGAANNFYFVFHRAEGEYFMWAACDDVWDRRFIEECIKKSNEEVGTIMVFSNFVNIDEYDNIIKVYLPVRFFPSNKNLYQRLKQYLLFYCRDGKANLIYGLWVRKELVQVPIFSFRSWGSDMNFVFRALIQGRFGLVDKVLFSKRVSSSFLPHRPFLLKCFLALVHRIEILFSPYFYNYVIDIVRTKRLTFVEKLKLIFCNFFVMFRLFFNRRV